MLSCNHSIEEAEADGIVQGYPVIQIKLETNLDRMRPWFTSKQACMHASKKANSKYVNFYLIMQ